MKLQARVNAVNKANAYAKELYEQLKPVFEPFVGMQILKQGGDLLAKVQKLIPELPCKPNLHVYRYRSDYSLMYMVRASATVDDYGSMSHEVGVYIGELHNGALIKMCDWHELRTDFTVEEVKLKREIYEQAQKVASEAESALHPFGKYDS